MMTFSNIEARILACLVEKEATVPENYPLTLNSLKLACNQKSNRTPVMNLEEGVILHTLKELKQQELIIIDEGGKVFKYAHRVHKILEINREFLAIIAVLILRGEQTLNEIFTRSKRIFNFETKEEVQECILQLIDLEFITLLPKKAGTRELRYMHNLYGKIDTEALEQVQALSPEQEKIQKLENRIDDLQDSVDDLLDILKEKGIIND